jgi:integrase/recombinase XerD
MLTIDSQKISGFRSFMGSKGKQKSTLDSYSRDMANFIQFLDEENVSSGNISIAALEEFKGWLQNRGSKPSSIRRAVIAIRMFFRWLEEIGELHGNPFEDLPVPSHEYTSARNIPIEKMNMMMDVARSGANSLKSSRDLVLLLILSREGLKASEVVSLTWSSFFAAGESGRLTIAGDRMRTIGLEAETTHAIKAYRKILQTDNRTKGELNPTSPLFVSFKGADARAVQFGITRHGLKFAIYELGIAADLKQLNAEQLRHFAMAHKISIGFTPEMLMNHLGLRRVGNIGKHLSV